MYYTVFVFILYNTSLYFPPPQEDWRLNINRYHLLTNYHASRHGLRHTGPRRRRASPWRLSCWEARCFSRIRRGNQSHQQEPTKSRLCRRARQSPRGKVHAGFRGFIIIHNNFDFPNLNYYYAPIIIIAYLTSNPIYSFYIEFIK